jgi:hypothetical protein
MLATSNATGHSNLLRAQQLIGAPMKQAKANASNDRNASTQAWAIVPTKYHTQNEI